MRRRFRTGHLNHDFHRIVKSDGMYRNLRNVHLILSDAVSAGCDHQSNNQSTDYFGLFKTTLRSVLDYVRKAGYMGVLESPSFITTVPLWTPSPGKNQEYGYWPFSMSE